MNNPFLLPAALAVAGFAPTILAQGSISRGPVDYGVTVIPADNLSSPNRMANFTAHRTRGNVLYHHWLYYRIQGDPREYPLNNGDINGDGSNTQGFTETYAGDTAVLHWQDVDERGQLSATWTMNLHVVAAHKGIAVHRLRVQNISNQPLALNLFAYIDYDVCTNQNSATGNANGSRQNVVSPTCAGGNPVFCEFYGLGIDHYEVAAWEGRPGTVGILNRLIDNNVNDLPDTGLPWPTGDYTGAVQWQNRQLLPGEAKTFIHVLGYQHSPCDGEASSVNYGVAGPGTNGIPFIQTTSMPTIRETAQVRVTNALPNQGGTILFGFGRTNLVLGNVTLLTNPIADGPISFDGTGSGTFGLTVPQDYSLCGLNVNVQCVFVDPGAAPFPIAHTDGIEWTISDY